MTVLLVGGVAWVGAHDLDPGKPISSTVKPVNVQVVSLDWKWLFIYPEQGIASVNKLAVPVGTPISFELTSSSVMNSFFVPQLGSQIYTMAGMATRLHLQADHLGTYRRAIRQVQRRRLCRHAIYGRCSDGRGFAQWVRQTREHWFGTRCAGLCRSGQAEQGGRAFHLSRRRSRAVQRHRKRWHGQARFLAINLFNVAEGRAMNLLGKLDWNAIPLHQPIIMGATAFMVLVVVARPRIHHDEGILGPIYGANGSPRSTTSASASCIAYWRSS